MITLSPEQLTAVNQEGSAIVIACPGSGKTRVLTHRVARGIQQLESPKHRVVALTFTNRAADEVAARLDQMDVDRALAWCGTIHAFALEWILRPYAPYCERLRRGFGVADEYVTGRILRSLRSELGQGRYLEVNTRRDRSGNVAQKEEPIASEIYNRYQSALRGENLIDYDDILYLAYSLLNRIPEIAGTLSSIFRVICVDEVQDIQDLQFGILGAISKASEDPIAFFFVGDPDQSIYESLGAVARTRPEIREELGLDEVGHLGLTGCYRSTQRIVDLYRRFRPEIPPIQALAEHADEAGVVTFRNQEVSRETLPSAIAGLVEASLADGIQPQEICVLAPQWAHLRSMSRHLVRLLPDVEFDAPGMSPLHCQRDNFWFKVARLLLTDPAPRLYRTRLRWAREVIEELRSAHGESLEERNQNARALLRCINSVKPPATDGLQYLTEAFAALSDLLGLSSSSDSALAASRQDFFQKAQDRIDDLGEEASWEVQTFKKLFKHPSGVVVSTCHGVKGEEYDTVIAFGLLRGYVPHWGSIIGMPPGVAADRESKLLYVICSRARRRIHLISESGRRTGSGKPYETATLLRGLDFTFDR